MPPHQVTRPSKYMLRPAYMWARVVLLVFCLHLGVGIAAPLIDPAEAQLICSGTGLKFIDFNSAGDEQASESSTKQIGLDCPLCSPLLSLGLNALGFHPKPLATPSSLGIINYTLSAQSRFDQLGARAPPSHT